MHRTPLDFSLVGILASVTGMLSDAGIPVFEVSTCDTASIFVKLPDAERACAILASEGHQIR